MKHVSSILLLAIALLFSIGISPKSFSAETGDNVLIIIKERYGSADTQFMQTEEAILMKQTLEEAGFMVHIASASGRKFWRRRVTNERGEWIEKVAFESDYKLGEVNVDNYIGFMITCSGLGENISIDRKRVLAFGETYSKPEEVAIAKIIVDSGKPIAAQHKACCSSRRSGGFEREKILI